MGSQATSTYSMNIFSGPRTVIDYYDPDLQPPLPLVEILARLDTFYNEGVCMFAKMMTALPSHNVKALPGTQTSNEK